MSPQALIAEVEAAQLRGRGGAGYPTAHKLSATAAGAGPRYLIANADEGDPSVYKDSTLLSRVPERVIEGMLIAAWAVQAEQAYIYLGGKHPECRQPLNAALAAAHERGLLGQDICGSGWNLCIDIVESDGLFVRGDSGAVVNTIEGRPPEPEVRYGRHLASSGLWGRPTLLLNVETLACLPAIIELGGTQFAALGSPHNGGSKLFSVAGCVARPGLYELRMGSTLGQLLEASGGLAPGATLQAVLLGGPSGSLCGPEALDWQLDYDLPERSGASIHAGGVSFLAEDCDLVQVVLDNLAFLVSESCGQCLPCREGLPLLEQLLRGLASGSSKPQADLKLLKQTIALMRNLSTCGLGSSAGTSLESLVVRFPERLGLCQG
jgi:NADH-quinone oxidoreductase subunit F